MLAAPNRSAEAETTSPTGRGRSALRWLPLILLGLGGWSPLVQAQASDGTFILDCGQESVLAGIHGRVGLWIDELEGWCVQIDGAGRWVSSLFTTPRAGGPSHAATFNLPCQSGEALYKLEGTSGHYVNSIKLFCIKIGADGHATGGAIERGTVRGGMAAFDPWRQTCTGDELPMKMTGFDGIYVDAFFSTICDYPVILKQLWIPQSQATGSATLPGEVRLSRNADQSFTISLSSNSTAVTVPNSVTVPAGRDRAAFVIQVQAVTLRNQLATLAATKGKLKVTALLTLMTR